MIVGRNAFRCVTGCPFAPADCQIAAIARSRGMAVATRNVRDIEDIEVEIVDPSNSCIGPDAKTAVVDRIKPTRIRRIIRSRLRVDWSHYFGFADQRRLVPAPAVGRLS